MKNLKIILLLTILLLSACGSGSKETPNLDGTSWTMVEINGKKALPTTEVWISFDGDIVGGKGGCNHYGGEVKMNSNGNIEFGMLAMTEMACMPEDIMQQETEFFQTLNEVRTYHVSSGILFMLNVDRDEIFTFTPRP
jgi:heat shock protein HslJ